MVTALEGGIIARFRIVFSPAITPAANPSGGPQHLLGEWWRVSALFPVAGGTTPFPLPMVA